MSKPDPAVAGTALSRRRFLVGGGTVLASVSALGTLLGAVPLGAAPRGPGGQGGRVARPVPAIFQDMPYFDFNGQGTPYVPPRSVGRATSEYTRSLSQEEFLRRHYYS